jgi:hypothetical protein
MNAKTSSYSYKKLPKQLPPPPPIDPSYPTNNIPLRIKE